MSFISAGFFLVMFLTAGIYYIIPGKRQWYILLIMSLTYYASYNYKFLFFILFTIISTYCLARIMDIQKKKRVRKICLITALLSNFGILLFLKYCNFTIMNVNGLLSLFNVESPLKSVSILMPLGISFYTFQTMSYIIDVYEKKYEPEKNIFKLALFTSFLPQLLQGPIGRYDRLSSQFFVRHKFCLKDFEYGIQRILWGLSKKLILADRAALISNNIFANPSAYTSEHIIFGLLMYSIYVYCDFAGGIDVVIGVSELFGIKLDENFRQPYFSKSLGEFWRRWHITLGTWMKDYIFYPFSISKGMLKFGKFAKKKYGKKVGRVLPICVSNILIFFIVGVWHGAAWKYILYGFYNGIIIALSNLLKPAYAVMAKKCHVNTESRGFKVIQIIRTFIIVNIGWLFDACVTASIAFTAFGRIFTGFNISKLLCGDLLNMGLNMHDYRVLFVGIIILFVTSLMKEKGVNLRDYVASRPLALRWAIYLVLIFGTAPFGFVGVTTEFIYAQF